MTEELSVSTRTMKLRPKLRITLPGIVKNVLNHLQDRESKSNTNTLIEISAQGAF